MAKEHSEGDPEVNALLDMFDSADAEYPEGHPLQKVLTPAGPSEPPVRRSLRRRTPLASSSGPFAHLKRKPGDKPVYFALCLTTGLVKIGTASDPARRIDALNIGASPVILLACIGGGEKMERELHRRFFRERVRGEWFSLRPEQISHEIEQYIRKTLIEVKDSLP